MKILLIAVYSQFYKNNSEFLGLELLQSSLNNNNYNSEIVNHNYSKEDFSESDKLIQEINWKEITLVGFSPFFSTFSRINYISQEIKKRNSQIHIFVGGAAVSHAIQETFNYLKHIDGIILGEGELTVVSLAECLSGKLPLNCCSGLALKSSEGFIITSSRSLIQDLDVLPWADRDMLKYYKPQYARIQTARGCEGNCSFCAESRVFEQENKKNWRGRSPKNVIEEMMHIIKEYNINSFSIVDESFEDPISTTGLSRLEAFADEILYRNLNIYYDVLMRAENISKISYNVWEKLRKSGLTSVLLGIENGFSDTLKLYGKKATVQDNEYAYNFLYHDLKINVIAGFIMFHPYAIIEELEENIKFVNKLNLQYSYRIFTHQINLFINTPLYEKVKKDKLLYNHSILNPYGYKFKDEYMSLVFNKINEVFTEVNKVSNSLYFVDYYHQVFVNMVKREKYLSTTLTDCRERMEHIKNILGVANIRLFQSVLDNPCCALEDFADAMNELVIANKEALKICNVVQKKLLLI